MLGRVRHGSHDGHWDREGKAAGARNNEDHQSPVDERQPLGSHEQGRHNGDQHAEDEHGRRVVDAEGVREPLKLALLGLRFFDRIDDLGEHRLGRGLPYLHLERTILVDGPGEDVAAGLPQYRDRLTGDGRLVHIGRASHDTPVDGYAFARPDHDDIPDRNLLDRAHHLSGLCADKRLPGHQFRERAKRPTGLVHRVGLENVAERVDEDQDGRFTPQTEQHGAAGTYQHEEMDRRREVDKGDQRLPRRIVDAGEDREHVEPVGDEGRCPQFLRYKGDESEKAAPVEGELLLLAPPGAAPALALLQRGLHARL